VIGFSFYFSEQEAVIKKNIIFFDSWVPCKKPGWGLATGLQDRAHPQRHESTPGRSTSGRTRGWPQGDILADPSMGLMEPLSAKGQLLN